MLRSHTVDGLFGVPLLFLVLLCSPRLRRFVWLDFDVVDQKFRRVFGNGCRRRAFLAFDLRFGEVLQS